MVEFSKSEKTAANEKFFCVDYKDEHTRTSAAKWVGAFDIDAGMP